MARIPESELERLKAEVSIERLAIAHGMKLTKKGRDLFTRCFLGTHSDSDASLVISPAKNLWHCLGCNAGGSVIDFVMKTRGVSFTHAVQLLKADLPSLAAAAAPPAAGRVVRHSTVRTLPGLAAADAEDQAVLRGVVDHYHEALMQRPEALAYLQGRGLTSMEMVETFRLGYANRTLGYRLPEKNRQDGAAIRGRLQKLGVYRASGHEHLAGSLVVPIFSPSGQVLQLYGRKIREDLRKGTPSHLYLPSPKRGVWNLAALQQSREVILCEALLDALSFWCAGVRNVTTAYGVHGLTEDHWEAFAKHGTERVLIAYDRDDAGEKAADELAPKLAAVGIEAWRIQFPRGMDANEYLCAHTATAAEAFGQVIRNAVWMGAGKAPARTSSSGEAGAAKKEEASRGAEPGPTARVAPASEGVPPAPAVAAAPDQIPPAPGPALAPPRTAPPEASPVYTPTPPALDRQGEDLVFHQGDRTFRIRDLEKNTSAGILKVNVRASRPDGRFHLDTVDLVVDRQRLAFIKRTAEELGLQEESVKKDVGRLLGVLEDARDERIRQHLAPKAESPSMSEADRTAALDLLRAPDLLDQVLADFVRSGVVGEVTNKLVGYLAAVSRKLERPLAIIIQSSSAAGKSSLMDAVLRFIPEEEKVTYSAMTGQALFYMQGQNLAHKILAIAEEEGAERASYALKLLQSEGVLTIISTGKDPATGKQVAHEYRVEGPVMLFLTTTRITMDPELENRCLLLSVDESREQTELILAQQRLEQTFAGMLALQKRPGIWKRHQDAQRLLRPLQVVNPYAQELTFQSHQTRARRDHTKYLTLIRALALLHQHQRPVLTTTQDGKDVAYVEATRQDIAVATRLMGEVLGRSSAELPYQTRHFLEQIVKLVDELAEAQGIERSEVRFTRRQVRERTGVGFTQTRIHLQRLEDMEFVLPHGSGVGQPRVYELLHLEKPESEAALLGGRLALREGPAAATTTANLAGPGGGVAGGWRPGDGGVAAPPLAAVSGTPSRIAPTAPESRPKMQYRGNGGSHPDRTDAPALAAAGPGRQGHGG